MGIKLGESQFKEVKNWFTDQFLNMFDVFQNTRNIENEIDNDVRSVLNFTLQEIYEHFGNKREFAEWIKMIKEVEAIHKMRVDTARKEGDLVSRDLVRRGVIDPINTVHKQMLDDGAATIAARSHAKIKGGANVEEIIAFMRKEISKYIKAAKVKVERQIDAI